MRPFLILQLRPETEASDSEFNAILAQSGLEEKDVHRIRLDQNPLISHLKLDDYSGVIVGGGPGCVSDKESEKDPLEKAIEDAVMGMMGEIEARDFPFLGCCYGMGILGHHLGGDVSKEKYSEEVGATDCALTGAGKNDDMLVGIATNFKAFVGHKEAVQSLPPDCVNLVSSLTCPFQMIRYKSNVYATQFHPEADAKEFELRINIYKNHGYFAPDDAEKLIEMVRAENIDMPKKILRNFVEKYKN